MAIIPTPELDKLLKVKPHSQRIGEFLEWLQGTGVVLARWQQVDHYRDEQLLPIHVTTEQLLADFFEIDLDVVEAERRRLLETIFAEIKHVNQSS